MPSILEELDKVLGEIRALIGTGPAYFYDRLDLESHTC